MAYTRTCMCERDDVFGPGLFMNVAIVFFGCAATSIDSQLLKQNDTTSVYGPFVDTVNPHTIR